jgi:two-component system sensor histidine kinase PilS (NtrC family)
MLLRSFIAIFLLCLGVLIGIFLLPSLHDTVFQVFLGLGILLIIVMAYAAMKFYIVRQRRTLTISGEEKEKSHVSFVVDTFQELVGQLKEKERELERLRKLAEDRAVRMETYNENILQSVPSGVVSIDNEMKIKSINQAAEKTLGIRAGDAIDRPCSEIFNEPLLGIVEDSKSLHRGEYPYITRDDRHIWLGVTASQLKNASNETIGLILVFTDLTDVKALQIQVELKKRLTQLGEMSAGIAHEIRNPMSVIAGYAKLLDKRVGDSEKVTVQAILTEIENIDKIISEFLAFAKPTDLNKVPVDLNRMIEETVSIATCDNKAVKVSVRTDDQVNIMADEVLMRQALTNLFLNACEAMPEGGNIDVTLSSLKDRIELGIRDTGRGIPTEAKSKIFLPFYTSKQKGTGLGLAIVQKVIVSHGGSIDVESKEGEGTEFRISIPAMT